jgi:chitodextrinase
MKKIIHIALVLLFGVLVSPMVNGQSKPFDVKTIFSTVNGETTPYPLYISLHTKTPDYGQKGVANIYEGEPTKEEVFNGIFGRADRGIGQFFLTDVKQNEPISFYVDYGYHNVDGDKRYHFDKLTYTYGDYKTNESVPQELANQDIAYDCNIFAQNCRVYQRHYFNFPRNEVHKNKATAYAKSLILRFYKGGKVAKTMILPIVLMGEYSEFIVQDLGPHQVKTILRAVPGDNSFSYIEAGKEYSVDKVISASLTNSKTKETSEKVEAGFDKFGISGGGSYESSNSTTNTKSNEQTNATNFTFSSKGRITNNTKYDRFIVEKWKYNYYLQSKCNAVWYDDIVQVNLATSIGMVPFKKIDDLNYFENELLETRIPAFKENQQFGEAKFWEDMIALNNQLKANARRKVGFSNAKGTEEENTRQEATSVSYKQEVSFSQEKSKEITAKVGVEIGFVSASVEAKEKTTLTVETKNSTENAQANSKSLTIGFSIDDDDDSDLLNVDLFEDSGFGAPVFRLVGNSKTSCPFEGGKQIDKPTIQVAKYESTAYADSAKFSDIELGKEVIFTLKVKNNSESQSNRTYRVRYPNLAFQLPKIEFIGYSSPTPEFELPFGQEKTIDLIVKNVYPTAKGYEEILMIVEPICADQEARNDDGYAADTVKLEAYWGATDKNRAPDNNFATTALLLKSDGSLQTKYINKFNGEAKFTNINANSAEEEAGITPVNWNKENGSVPEITNSVWFKFVVSSPVMEVRLCDPINDGFDSQIAVYKVGNVNDMSTYQIIASNDKGLCRTGNIISESAAVDMENLTLGDTLYVLVDGFKGAQSNFGITVESFPPKNDPNCEAINLDLNNDVRKGTIIRGLSNYNATVEINESMLIPQATNPIYGWKEDEIQHSVWFRFSAPKEETVSVEVLNASFDTQIAVYGIRTYCGGENFNKFELLKANDDLDTEGGFGSKLTLKGIPYDPKANRIYYYILVDGYKGAVGTFDLQVKIGLPDNDLIENAITLQIDASGQGVFNNGGATSSDAEQVISPPKVPLNFKGGWGDNELDGERIQHSVWFKFIAPAEGAVQISTCNQASFSNQLALYKIGDLANYSTYEYLGADDGGNICRIPPSNQYPNGTGVRGSILNVTDLIAGETYYLLVDGNATSFGQFSIDLLTQKITEPPVNDDACDAIALPVNGKVQSGFRNFAATIDKYEKKIIPAEWLDKNMGGTVWFTFIAPASGEAEISLCDLANFDTQIAVYSVEDCKVDSNFVLIGANEDGPKSCATNGDSYLPLKNLKAGQKYYLVVDGFGGNRGSFGVKISDKITPGPANDDVVNAIELPVDGEVKSGFSNSFATVRDKEQDIRPVPANNQDCTIGWCDKQVDNSVWFKFVAPADGKVNISTCDLADFDTQLALYSATNVSDFSTFTLKAANDAGPQECSTNFDSYLPVTGLKAGQTYYIMVDGFDGDNGAFSISLTGVGDVKAPTAPTAPTAGTTTETSAQVSWTAATDNVGVAEYEVFVDGKSVGKTATTSFTITGLAGSKTYAVTIAALDAAGNKSGASTSVNVTTKTAADNQAPASPTGLKTTEVRTTGVDISWTAATDNVGVKEYKIYVDGALTATVTGTTYSLSGLTAGTAYSIYVTATDAAGNTSTASTALKVTTSTGAVVDTQAPSVPTGLAANEVSDTGILLSWSASTDNVAVSGYDIYVDGTKVGTASETSFIVTGLTKLTAYSIQVTAKDAAGNASEKSTALKVTTVDAGTLSAIEFDTESSFKVYPNPFMDKIQLKHPDVELPQGSVQVIDIQGKIIFTPIIENINSGLSQFNLSDIPEGIQLLRIKSGSELVYKRIIKK